MADRLSDLLIISLSSFNEHGHRCGVTIEQLCKLSNWNYLLHWMSMGFHTLWIPADHRVWNFTCTATADVQNLSMVKKTLWNTLQIDFHLYFYVIHLYYRHVNQISKCKNKLRWDYQNQTVTVLAKFLGISGFIFLIQLIFYTKICKGIKQSKLEKCFNFGTVININFFSLGYSYLGYSILPYFFFLV